MQDEQRAIWIVDDDSEDLDLVKDIFEGFNGSHILKVFESGEQLLKQLEQSKEAPFIIIADVNLPKMSGFELRERMLQTPNNKYHSVPFIFWSTSASPEQIRRAFHLRAHGFFLKEADIGRWRACLVRIIEYWQLSLMPSKEDRVEKA